MNEYPAIAFIVKHGKLLALVAGVLPPIFIAALMQAVGLHWIWSLLIVAGAPLCYLCARGAVEMVMVLADMLLPK